MKHLLLSLALALVACGDPGVDTPPADDGDDGGLQPRPDAGAEPEAQPEATPEVQPEPEATPEATPEPEVPVDPLDGLRDQALRDALNAMVSGHRVYNYGQARDFMYGIRAAIDVIDGQIECVYTGRKTPPDQTRTPGGFNTEHSWPRSEGADIEPELSDLHHLFPTTEEANQERASLPFGETSCAGSACPWDDGGSEMGAQSGRGDVFQVRALRQGDIARAHFYFAIRYNRRIDAAEETTLRQWHAQDPPDDRERARNDAIERFQNNRNPFVDRPDLVDLISDL